MSGGKAFDASELRSLGHDLTKAGAKAQAGARMVVAKTAADITADAKAFAPVDTGNLRASIGHDLFDTSGETGAEIGPTTNYGGFVEWGTSRMAPQPYLGPAFDRRIPGFEKALGDMIDGTWKG